MEETTTEIIMNEMKDMIASKTDCMIESYGKVLNNTIVMFRKSGVSMLSNEEVAKRADMFWHGALSRIEKEQAEAKARLEREAQEQSMNVQRSMNPMQGMPPQGMPQRMSQEDMNKMMASQGGESPCAKKARESAEKIATLEAEVIESKEENSKTNKIQDKNEK